MQARFKHVKDHKRVDTTICIFGNQGIGDFVLDIAWRYALHALPLGTIFQFLDVLLGESREGLAIVKFEFLKQGQIGLFGLF